jgi:ATP-binding cassette subfamily B protein
MLKLFKYLKSSILSIIVIILLLVTQAVCDLKLPEYTSKIVNVGIQQNGIENAAATVITAKKYDNIVLFLSDDEKEYLADHYDLLTTEDYDNYKDEYPILKTENLYKLNTKDKDVKEKISDILSLPLMMDYMITSGKAAEYGFAVPENMDFYTSLKYMTSEQIDAMLSNVNKKLGAMPESMLTGTAILAIQNEYKNIGIDTGALQTNYILISGAMMLAIALLIMCLAVVVGLLGSRLAANLAMTLRSKVFSKVVSFSKTEMKSYGTASLITRTTNDIQQVQQIIVMLMRVVFYAPIIAVGGIIKTTSTSGSMGWIIALAVTALIIIISGLFTIVMPKFKKLQILIDKLNLVTREILTGIPVIRAFNNEKHEEERFDEANSNLNKVNLFVNRTMAFMMPIMMLLMNVVCIAIVWKGAYGINDGVMQVGDMMAYIQYSMQIIMSFLFIGMMSIMLPRASVSANRIVEIINTDVVIKEANTSKKFDTSKKGVVEFKRVSFRYPDANEDVITDVNFTSKPGTTTAFIGSTGSGKSTLINLIPRFYDVTEGAILIDGVDIKDVSTKDLRAKIGYVPQKGMLFSGDVESNIKYGDAKITDKQMKEAASIAQASDFIENLDGKYEAEISQGGTNVSGGQRQRLSIARAIAINPDIFIFDDSFSALDLKTDAKLRGELTKVTKDKTVFIVAQRISTILNADQIVVLDEGKVVGIGNHKDLMKTCDVYREIALSQLSEEELSNV